MENDIPIKDVGLFFLEQACVVETRGYFSSSIEILYICQGFIFFCYLKLWASVSTFCNIL